VLINYPDARSTIHSNPGDSKLCTDLDESAFELTNETNELMRIE
jgi:hypothetical protein